ncbi:unnamed protein product [Rangifer tarandus platyrhynchus]|uniref:Uncharacterized protein n=1 Tax=Rangifer tarandus platyrhynchus TaxID=3082113 RepID=A0AC59YS07_RANTA
MRAPEATWRGVGHLWALGQELSSPLSVLLTLRLTSGLEPVFCAAGGSQHGCRQPVTRVPPATGALVAVRVPPVFTSPQGAKAGRIRAGK